MLSTSHFTSRRRPAGRSRALAAAVGAVAALALPAEALAYVNFSGPVKFAAGDGPRSVAVGDFNGDADPDLAVAGGLHRVSVLLNQR